MKLSNRLLINYIITFLIVSIVIILATSLVFNNAMTSYLKSSVNAEFDSIVNDISLLYLKDEYLSSADLSRYALNKTLDIQVYDIDKDLIARFNGLNSMNNEDYQLMTKEYNLINEKKQILGTISLSYYEDIYMYNESTNNFIDALTKTYGVLIVIGTLLGYLISLILSRSITKPIAKMNVLTKSLEKNIYSNLEVKSNIYEIDALASSLNFLSDTLSLQDKYRQNYSEDIAHELRTPLTNLQLHLEGVRDQVIDLSPDVLDVLISEVSRLNVMVDNLHYSFQMDNEENSFNLEKTDVNDILSLSVQAFMPKLLEKDIELVKNLDDNTYIYADKQALTQTFNNLIENAIRALDYKGKLSITTKRLKKRVIVSIQDNGIGIAEDEIDHIFERFYRVDNDRNRAYGGHGLGLAIVKNFVEAMNGKISVLSNERHGTEFILSFEAINQNENQGSSNDIKKL